MTVSTTKTPNTSTEYSNSAIELHTSTTDSLKTKATSLLEINRLISRFNIFFIKINVMLTKKRKTLSFWVIKVFREPQNCLKNGSLKDFLDEVYYLALLIKTLVMTNNHFNIWVKNSCSSQGKKRLVELYIKETQPSIKKATTTAFTNIFFYYSTKNEFVTSIEELEKILGYKKSRIKQILQELEKLNFIKRRRGAYFNDLSNNNNSLVLQLINIEPLSDFLREKPLRLLATYVKTETLHARGMIFKTAVLKDIHDLEDSITLKTDRISYDDETSNFLKKLNAGDVISCTPSINKPTFKGIKHPLNLRMYSRKENEGYMMLFGTFDSIQKLINETHGLTRCAWFTNVASIDFSVKNQVVCVLLQEDCCNSQTLDQMNEGQLIVFTARVNKLVTEEGRELVKIEDVSSIITRDEYYDHYGAIA